MVVRDASLSTPFDISTRSPEKFKMMATLLCALGVLILHPSPEAPAPGADNAEVRKAIDQGNAQYIKSFKEADAAGVAGVYDQNGSRLNPKGVVIRGRDAVQADLERLIKGTGPVTATIDTTDLWVVDDIAYETGKWSYTFTPQGRKEQKMGGRYVTLWKKQADGGWKMWADMGVPAN